MEFSLPRDRVECSILTSLKGFKHNIFVAKFFFYIIQAFMGRGLKIKNQGTVRPDWICMRVVSLESPLKGLSHEINFDNIVKT
jgi:hypothetical protein